jgi:hypothetical protein
MKSIFTSKVFWVAFIQAIIGGGAIFFTNMDMLGYVAILKSVGDIALRFVTTEPVTV